MPYDAYITKSFYDDTYKGVSIEEATFSRLALRASDLLDSMTMREVRRKGLSSYSTDNQELIKLAVCALCEAEAQVNSATDSTGFAVTSETVGPYSYSGGATEAAMANLRSGARAKAASYLITTGVLYSGIA